MCTRRAVLWVVVPLVVALTGACGPKVDDPADVAAIKEIPANWSKARTAGDVDAALAGLAEDAFRLLPNQPIVSGKDAIRAGLQTAAARAGVDLQSTAEDVWVSGNLAVARGVYTSKRTPKLPGEAATEVKGKWLDFFRKQADGSWKTAADCVNVDVPVSQALVASSEDELALLQVERDWGAAWRAQDAAAMDRILATDYVESFDGQLTTKSRMLADMKAGVYKVESAEAGGMRVLVFGDHAVVNGTSMVKQTLRGKDTSGSSRWTDTFAKRDGRWQAVMSYSVKVQ